MKNQLFTLSCLLFCPLTTISCVISEESATQLNSLSSVAGILVDEEDAEKLENLKAIGEIIITVEETK